MEQPDSSRTPREYHAVRFYDSDTSLARIVAEFFHEGFENGSPAIAVATATQRTAIVEVLRERSWDVAALQRTGQLVLLDAEETLATFMTEGRPDARRFRVRMCQVLERACQGRTNCKVRLFGQMVDVLWQRGEREAAVRLEVLWNRFAQAEAFSVVCGYVIGNFYKSASFDEICGQHSHNLSTDGQAAQVTSMAHDRNRHRNDDDRRRGVSDARVDRIGQQPDRTTTRRAK